MRTVDVDRAVAVQVGAGAGLEAARGVRRRGDGAVGSECHRSRRTDDRNLHRPPVFEADIGTAASVLRRWKVQRDQEFTGIGRCAARTGPELVE